MGVLMYSSPGGIIAATVITEVLAVSCVGLRFYSRRWRRQKFITSDWLILVALVIGTGLAVMEIYGVTQKALGYPIGATFADDVVLERFAVLKRLNLAFMLTGVLGTGFVKLSVCFLYWHLFSRVVFRRFLMVWITIVALWMVAFTLAGLFECGTHLTAVLGSPEEYFKHCQAAVPAGYAMMATDVVTDFVTLVIPIPVVLSLSLDRKTKILTVLTFMIGSLSVGASMAKTYIYVITATGQTTEDAMLTMTGLSLWNLLEVQIGIIAACGPTLRKILAHAIISPTSESIKSLLSRIGGGMTRTSSASKSQGNGDGKSSDISDIPSFVRLSDGKADSLEQLQAKAAYGNTRRSGSAGSSIEGKSERDASDERVEVGYYEMESVSGKHDVRGGDSIV